MGEVGIISLVFEGQYTSTRDDAASISPLPLVCVPMSSDDVCYFKIEQRTVLREGRHDRMSWNNFLGLQISIHLDKTGYRVNSALSLVCVPMSSADVWNLEIDLKYVLR